jgi:methylmalonyl-CoA/ethylmalonyl-CoA epimerase
MKLGSIGQIAITVKDVAAAVAFYRDKLGLPLLFEVSGMAFLQCDQIRLMLSLSEKSETYSSIIYFRVPDIEAVHGELEARGVAFETAPHLLAKMPDHDLWMAFLRDPSGNLLGLMTEKRD